MPCSNKKARLLLKENKAKIVKYNPFTIQLLYPTGETVQEVNVGVDTGAKHIGIAITSDDKVLVKGEIELRQDIHNLMIVRKTFRRHRRNKKTRYRQDRFLNRKRKDNWLPPSINSRVNSTFKWIDTFCSLVFNPKLHIEVGKFDVAKMINPDISGKDYQNGDCKDYYTVRYFVFARDEYTCQVCHKKNKILHTHHILYKSEGGTNRADNLITVCSDCHTSENHKQGSILYKWMKEHKKVKQYRESVFMNIVRKRTFQQYPNAIITYGNETTPNRKELELDKTHYNDAITISGIKIIKYNPKEYFMYKQFRKKKRSLHESIPRKGRSHKNVTATRANKNVPFRNGVFMNDMIKYNNQTGWVYGFCGGERSHDALIRNAEGNLIKMTERKNSLSIYMKKAKIICHNNGWQFGKLCENNMVS
jgi:hypothetical protein